MMRCDKTSKKIPNKMGVEAKNSEVFSWNFTRWNLIQKQNVILKLAGKQAQQSNEMQWIENGKMPHSTICSSCVAAWSRTEEIC
jgi:hypothetical protein